MALDGKLLRKAKEGLDAERTRREAQLQTRRLSLFAREKQIAALDAALRSSAADILAGAFSAGGDVRPALEKVRDENLRLQDEMRLELRKLGLPEDYLDEKFMCPVCLDTGYDGTKLCSCLLERYAQEQKNSLSALYKLGDATFDAFDPEYYPSEPDPVTGISPRQNMDFVYEFCVRYAEKFGTKGTGNLFMRGGTGLGKTFLSACIARTVSERGFSVVYETACGIFGAMEREKFGKNSDDEDTHDETARFFACDLLILDDLGTEMTTAFTISALYEIINSRLLEGKQTIVSSNLTDEELRRRYTPQILSRLEGEYHILPFTGRDIRLLKKKNI